MVFINDLLNQMTEKEQQVPVQETNHNDSLSFIKKNWKNFFNNHNLDDKIKSQINHQINKLTFKDIEITITNHNTEDIDTGPRPYNEFSIGSFNCELHCCGYFWERYNKKNIYEEKPGYETLEEDFYSNEKFDIISIKELIFASLFEGIEEEEHYQFLTYDDKKWSVNPIFNKYFLIKFLELKY